MTAKANADNKNTSTTMRTVARLLLATIRLLMRPFPLPILFFFSDNLARVAPFFLRQEIRIAKTQMNFGLTGNKPHAHQLLQHVCRSFLEIFLGNRYFNDNLLPFNSRAKVKFETIGVPYETIVSEQESTVIVLSAHIGNFELLPLFITSRGGNVWVVGRDVNHPLGHQLLELLREENHATTIWRKDPRAAANLIKVLRGKYIFGILVDQDTKLENGFAPFFGLEAASPVLPIRLGIRYQLPFITSFIVRLGDYSHRIYNHRISYDPDSPTVETDILTEYNRHLEAVIKEFPAQWLWWHRRWRRRPGVDYAKEPEQLRKTEDYIAWVEEQCKKRATNLAADH